MEVLSVLKATADIILWATLGMVVFLIVVAFWGSLATIVYFMWRDWRDS